MSKTSGFSKLKSTLYHTASALGVVSTGCLATTALSATTFYTADPTNTSILSVGLGQSNLGNSTLSNPSTLTVGSNLYNYSAIMFTATEDGIYKFGQTSAKTDTIMILYGGVYDPAAPGSGALVGNDDTLASKHKDDLNDQSILVQCGSSTSYCPQVEYSVVAGQTYTLFVSSFNTSYNSAFILPFQFYSTGSVIFGQYTGRSPIDLARTNYGASELGNTIDPTFVGGTLHMDQANAIYATDFTLSSMASNTINQNDEFSRFDGVFSDGVAGTPGYITIDNSGTDGAVVFNGINTYTGSTTLKGGTLAVSQDANLGDAAASLVLDGGALFATDSFDSSREVTLASTGTINVASDKTLDLSGVASGVGSLTKEGAGSLVLNADNTYTGSTTISAGALVCW